MYFLLLPNNPKLHRLQWEETKLQAVSNTLHADLRGKHFCKSSENAKDNLNAHFPLIVFSHQMKQQTAETKMREISQNKTRTTHLIATKMYWPDERLAYRHCCGSCIYRQPCIAKACLGKEDSPDCSWCQHSQLIFWQSACSHLSTSALFFSLMLTSAHVLHPQKGQQDPNDTLNLIIKQCTICNYCVPALIPLIFRTQFFS